MTAFPRPLDPAAHPKVQLALDALPAGRVARVVAVEGPSDDAARLKSLGICVGRQVQLMQSGDPLIVRVLGARVGLARRLAADVLVETPPA